MLDSPGFLGQNRTRTEATFVKFSKVDKVSNTGREELLDLLPRLDWVFVSRVFASQKLKRHYPVGVYIRPRRSIYWHNLKLVLLRRRSACCNRARSLACAGVGHGKGVGSK